MAGENNIAARHLNDVSLLVFEAATKSEVRPRRLSSPGESHPEALPELYVSVSTHTAPMVKTDYAGAPKAQACLADDREPPSAKSMPDSGDCVASYISDKPSEPTIGRHAARWAGAPKA